MSCFASQILIQGRSKGRLEKTIRLLPYGFLVCQSCGPVEYESSVA